MTEYLWPDGSWRCEMPVADSQGIVVYRGDAPNLQISDSSFLQKMSNIKEGVKHDEQKPDLSLLPAEFLVATAQAFMHGEKKYGRYNYRGGMEWSRLVAAIMRHMVAFNEGEDLDTESGYQHLGHAAAGIAMLLVYYKNNLGTDNRHE